MSDLIELYTCTYMLCSRSYHISNFTVVRVGFMTTVVTGSESDPELDVCVSISNDFELFLVGRIEVQGDTATGIIICCYNYILPIII